MTYISLKTKENKRNKLMPNNLVNMTHQLEPIMPNQVINTLGNHAKLLINIIKKKPKI